MSTSTDDLKLSATNFGFNADWVADVLEKWGPTVLKLAIEAARHGLSVSFIVELVEKFGPFLLQLVVELLNKRAMMGAVPEGDAEVVPGPVIPGEDNALVEVIIERLLPQILNRILPVLVEKLAPLIVQALLSLITKYLQPKNA